jgi:hypothetical protein
VFRRFAEERRIAVFDEIEPGCVFGFPEYEPSVRGGRVEFGRPQCERNGLAETVFKERTVSEGEVQFLVHFDEGGCGRNQRVERHRRGCRTYPDGEEADRLRKFGPECRCQFVSLFSLAE